MKVPEEPCSCMRHGPPVKLRRISRTIVIRLHSHPLHGSSEYMLRSYLKHATLRALSQSS